MTPRTITITFVFVSFLLVNCVHFTGEQFVPIRLLVYELKLQVVLIRSKFHFIILNY